MEYSELELKIYVRKHLLSNQFPLSSISIVTVDEKNFVWSVVGLEDIPVKTRNLYGLRGSGNEYFTDIENSGFDKELVRIRRHLNVTKMLREFD